MSNFKKNFKNVVLTMLTVLCICSVFLISANAWFDFPSLGGGNNDTSTTFDYIDIFSNLTAKVEYEGEIIDFDFTITTNDAQYVKVTANEVGENFKLSGKVSTSTESNGDKQIRIEGTFPKGTKENPAIYAVTLSKDIEIVSGITRYVVLSATTHFYDSSNTCQGMGSTKGIDLELESVSNDNSFGGNTSTEQAKGNINIQKNITGLVHDKDVDYTYTIYKMPEKEVF